MKKKLRNIEKADLRNFAKMCEMREQAIKLKAITRSKQSTLRFFTAAMHALAVGNDPPALFANNVHDGRWDTSANIDEDNAETFMRTKECPAIMRRTNERKDQP